MSNLLFNKQATLPSLNISDNFPFPEKIGPYKVKSLFKKGGMSILYLGYLEHPSKPVIIKVLPPELVKQKDLVTRFLKEAKIISMSNHPNIVKYFSQGEWEQGLYIAMEYVQGISLREYVQTQNFSSKKALEIVLQIAYAICHLHSLGIIHHDLKPENILITPSDEIKVIDFGIARFQEEIPNNEKKSQIVGTPFYMSPEHKKNPHILTFQMDIYALGIITYELLVKRPFSSSINLSFLPKNLKEIISKAMKVDPKNAYSDVVEFITDISKNIKLLEQIKNQDGTDFANKSLKDVLLGEKIQKIPNVELSVAQKKSSSFFGIYLDCFKISEKRYLLALAENTFHNSASMNSALIFRGMVKNAAFNYFKSEKETLSSFLSSLNTSLLKESLKEIFAFTLLMFETDKNEFVLGSCGHDLFHISKEKKVQLFPSQNPLLGSAFHNFSEKKISYFSGDAIILPSLEILKFLKSDKQTLIKKDLFANMETSSEFSVKKIMLELKVKNIKGSALLLGIKKT